MLEIFDSWKLTTSPIKNWVDDRTDISISVADTWPTICATAPVSDPTILSPKIVDVFKDNPAGNVNLSNVGAFTFNDSYTPIILTASGQLSDISLSSTLKP